LIKDYDTASNKLDEFNRIKTDYEKIQNELNTLKKLSKEDHDRLVKENSKKIELLENDNYDEVKRIENQLKLQIEKLKQRIAEKEQEIKEKDQENNLLKSQIDLLDNNISNSKQSWVESK